MSSVHKMFEGKLDHPMFNEEETLRLLAGLPKDDSAKALDEVTGWLASVKEASGFPPETRTLVIMLLDETGLQLHDELMQRYFSETRFAGAKGKNVWQGLHAFKKALAGAYAACMDGYLRAESKHEGLRDIMPVVCVRLLRASAEQMKLELMQGLDADQSVWEHLFSCYKFSEAGQFDDTLIFAYHRQAMHISPRRELARAMLLYLSSLDSHSPEYVEVSFRVAGRFSNLFDFKPVPDADCAFSVDLSKPAPPGRVDGSPRMSPTLRFFGAARAVPKIAEIIDQHEQGRLQFEQRFGKEFDEESKLAVLRDLRTFWGNNHPLPGSR